MSKTQSLTFAGQAFQYVQKDMGQGGQGTVHQVRRTDAPNHLAIVKELSDTTEHRDRLQYLLAQGLGHIVPGVFAPLAESAKHPAKKIWYVAPYSPGVALEDDRPRSISELLEIAVLLDSVWHRLERAGIAHGDLAPSNVFIRGDGRPDLIDLDNFASKDPKVPPAPMIGQHAMMAPELRQARGQSGLSPGQVVATLESDRFTWGLVFNMLLLGRHPADGLADTPKKFDWMMMSDVWLEDQRELEAGEVPVEVLGKDLPPLFRAAASVDPDKRPESKAWLVALARSLERVGTHSCGGAFVVDDVRGRCPWCGERYQQGSGSRSVRLTVRNERTGKETEMRLPDGGFVYLGRDDLPDMSRFVSARHVRLYRQANQLYLEHVGQNETQVKFAGESKSYCLRSYHDELGSTRWQGMVLILGDAKLELSVKMI